MHFVKSLWALVFLTVGILVVVAIEPLVQEFVPEIDLVNDYLLAHPLSWLAISVMCGLAIAYQGHKSLSRRLLEYEQTIARQNDQIKDLQAELKEERSLRGTDLLTGLPNQISFESDLEELLQNEQVRKQFCLVYCDLFNLKQINDKQGDEYGSRYIQKCAKLISDSMYRKEKMFRAELRNPEFGTDEPSRVFRSRDAGDEFYLLIKSDELGALFALKRILCDLLGQREELENCIAAPGKPRCQLDIGFRAGVLGLETYSSVKKAVHDVKAAFNHTRFQDLPDAPSSYVVLGKRVVEVTEKERSVLEEIDGFIRAQSCNKG